MLYIKMQEWSEARRPQQAESYRSCRHRIGVHRAPHKVLRPVSRGRRGGGCICCIRALVLVWKCINRMGQFFPCEVVLTAGRSVRRRCTLMRKADWIACSLHRRAGIHAAGSLKTSPGSKHVCRKRHTLLFLAAYITGRGVGPVCHRLEAGGKAVLIVNRRHIILLAATIVSDALAGCVRWRLPTSRQSPFRVGHVGSWHVLRHHAVMENPLP